MPELIDREETLQFIDQSIEFVDESSILVDGNSLKDRMTINGLLIARRIVSKQPTIEADPVRHGRWIECDYKTLEHGEIESAYKAGLCCSECRTGFKKNHMTYKAFCPACGARMDATDTNVGGKGNEEMDLSPLDFLAAEYGRKHPQGIRFVDCMEGADDGACKKV